MPDKPAMPAMVKKPSVALKLVELLFGVISIAVVIDGYPVETDYVRLATIYGTQVGFVMISIILVMSYLMETPLHKNILLMVSIAGGVMWLVAGALMIAFYTKYSNGWFKLATRLAVSGAFAIMNAVVFFVDAGLTAKG